MKLKLFSCCKGSTKDQVVVHHKGSNNDEKIGMVVSLEGDIDRNSDTTSYPCCCSSKSHQVEAQGVCSPGSSFVNRSHEVSLKSTITTNGKGEQGDASLVFKVSNNCLYSDSNSNWNSRKNSTILQSSSTFIDCNTESDINDPSVKMLSDDSISVLKELRESWGVTVSTFNLKPDCAFSQSRLTKASDAVLLSQAWNKILAFRSKFTEALVGRWRMLVAVNKLQGPRDASHSCSQSAWPSETIFSSLNIKALRMVESNIDPIAKYFGSRIVDLEVLLISALDSAVRSICPHQVVQRESYRPLNGSADPDPRISQVFFYEDECVDFSHFCLLFANYGINPWHWLSFCTAFLWTMKSHNPFITDDEKDDLKEGTRRSIHARFIAGMFTLPVIEATLRRAVNLRQGFFRELKVAYLCAQMGGKIEFIGERVFKDLFTKFPEIADHFAEDDVNEMSLEFCEMIKALVLTSAEMSDHESCLRRLFNKQSMKWIQLGLPKEAFLLIGKIIFQIMEPFFEEHVKMSEGISGAFWSLYKEAMQFVLHPVLFNQNLRSEAFRFYEDVANELRWSPQELQKRIFEVDMEISTTGQYTHTHKELEIGAKLAWRNSSKCIGRIAWNTLIVRDCRHCNKPTEVFNEVVEHLKLATTGESVQCVMSVFRPQGSQEMWGMRFWNSQFIRYAGYKDEVSGNVLGDPANEKFTSYLINKKLWTPPFEKSPFDILPIVLKIPGNDVPFVYELPKAATPEVHLEHPKFPAVRNLGYKWSAIPAISNFMMNVGGIKYPCAPFNGWFVSIEVVRNLLERYSVSAPLAIAMGIDLRDKFLAQKLSVELESAISFSFEKNEVTVVDSTTVGKSFMTHCKREQSAGRECPAQWSWIGGLVGPTNPTWHLEMRDFYKTPQYDYCCDPWQVCDIDDEKSECDTEVKTDGKKVSTGNDIIFTPLPSILIAYGSETGTAEAAATSLERRLRSCQPTMLSLNEVSALEADVMVSFSHIIIICSTFGAGKPPSNAKSFFQTDLNGRLNPDVEFAVLALGSSLYPDFCSAGKTAHSKMEAAGARPMIDVSFADAAQCNQSHILSWSVLVRKLILPDSVMSQIKAMNAMKCKDASPVSNIINWSTEKEINGERYGFTLPTKRKMRCIENTELFEGGDVNKRSSRHVKIELPDGMVYKTADHLAVTPVNSATMVTRFCKCFGFELERAAVHVGFYGLQLQTEEKKSLDDFSSNHGCKASICWLMKQPFAIESVENGRKSLQALKHLNNKSLFEVLSLQVDFSFHAKSYLVDLLSALSSALNRNAVDNLKKLSKSTQEQYNTFLALDTENLDLVTTQFPTIVDFLEHFQDLFCQPMEITKEPLLSLADIMVLMPRLKPRHYSISSSDVSAPRTVSLTVGIVNGRTPAGKVVRGVCSHYLANLRSGDMLNGHVVHSTFKPPQNYRDSIIMIGAGSGLAPFMGFLQERKSAMMAARTGTPQHTTFGECHLFFGCRNSKETLYKEQLREWESTGVMHLHVAHSREEGKPKQYVQDCLEQEGETVVAQLTSEQRTPHVYICGSVTMAKCCEETCISLLQKYGNMSKLSATRYISTMRIQNRWNLDVWGVAKKNVGIRRYSMDTTNHVMIEAQRTLEEGFKS